MNLRNGWVRFILNLVDPRGEEEERKLRKILFHDTPGAAPDWTAYRERLRQRLPLATHPVPAPRPSPWARASWVLSPALAAVFMVWIFHRTPAPVIPVGGPDAFHLVSDRQQKTIEELFHEMDDLFPGRVNWISYADGKVDFGVSAEARPGGSTGVFLAVTVPRAGADFAPRFFIRPGQEVTVRAAWEAGAEAQLRLTLSADARRARALFRLTDADDTAGLEGTVSLNDKSGAALGVLRWKKTPLTVGVVPIPASAPDGPHHDKKKI